MGPPADAVTVFIALGANQGDRLSQLRTAHERLDGHPAVTVMTTSPVYASEAHTMNADAAAPDYLNAVAKVHTTLAPKALLHVCQAFERAAGRDRGAVAPTQRWAPRPLDLDILIYGRRQIDTPKLTVPHPRLGERRFVLQPWSDIAPNLYVPPPFDATVQELLAQCPDTAALHRTPHPLESTSSEPT